MYILSNIFKNEDTLKFLSLVVQDKNKEYEKLPFILNMNISNSQYYLCTVVEFIIKYYILFPQEDSILEFIKQLSIEYKGASDYKTFFTNGNRLIAKSIQSKLGLTDMLHVDNKQKIVSYAYDHYIKEGYCFHSFPSGLMDNIAKEGLLPTKPKLLDKMIEIDDIFKKHNVKDIFGYDLISFFAKEHFHLTDSASMAFYYALHVPIYFNDFIGNCSKKTKTNPYLLKNKDVCASTVENFCNQVGLTNEQKKIVMTYFDDEWQMIKASDLIPMMSFVKRKIVGRDQLDDYEDIMANVEQQDIIYSLARIFDSRNKDDVRYTKIIPYDVRICRFPHYQYLLDYTSKVNIDKKEEPIKKENKHITDTNGKADVIALSGILLIVLGITWLIIKHWLVTK